jgi:hypothetical protein
VIRRPHGRKENQCVMNRQQSTSISGKHHPENHKGEGSTECAGSIPRQLNGMRSSRLYYIDTGVPMKSRLPSSMPQWRAMS